MQQYNSFIKSQGPVCQQHVATLLGYLNRDSVILDVGSNIGLFSKAICESTLYKKIYLFEPAKEYCEASKILLKEHNNLVFVNKGVSDAEDKLTLYKYKGAHNIGWNTFLEKDPMLPGGVLIKNIMKPEICDLITLSKYCMENEIDNVDLIKIDVEGFEHRVINGAMEWLSKLDKKPYLFIEVGWGTNHPEWDEAEKVYQKLFKIGYKKVEFDGKTHDIIFEPNRL